MTKKPLLFTLALVSMLTLGLTSTVFAHGSESDDDSTSSNTRMKDDSNTSDSSTENENESEDVVDDNDNQRLDRKERQIERIDERRTELKEKFAAMKSERKEKLEGKRFELCQDREDTINSHLDKSAENSKKKLIVFQKIEEGVKAFYVAKDLSSDQYTAATASADEKEAAAIAAIDAVAAQDFSCDAVDGAKPDGVIREAVKARHDALQAYRTAVKDLIKVVKQALNSSTEATDTEGES